MSTLYQSANHWNQYLIRSARAHWWDYGKNGVYYVTLCTKHRFPFFGRIQEGKMQLSVLGAVVKQLWTSIPSVMSGVHLSSFVIMPNHIHAIIILDRPLGQEPLKPSITNNSGVVLHPKAADKAAQSAFFKSISPQKGSLPHIIRKFKGLVTRAARKAGWVGAQQPLWQARYHDRVIRDPNEFFKLAHHINNNVATWEQDDYFFPIPTDNPQFQWLPPAEEASPSSNTPIARGIPFKGWQLSIRRDSLFISKAYWQSRPSSHNSSWQYWLADWLEQRKDGS